MNIGSKDRTRILAFYKYLIYALLLLLLYVLQTTPRLFEIFEVKPMLVVPAAIAMAMHEGEFAGGIYAAFAGLLCDMGGFGLFGFNGIIFLISGVAAGLLVIYMMRCNVVSCVLFVLIAMLARGGIYYTFAFGIWNYEYAWRIFVFQILPTIIYTAISAIPIYYIFRAVNGKFKRKIRY